MSRVSKARQRAAVLALVCLMVSSAIPLASPSPVSAAGPCDTPLNEIVAENCLPGNPASEWDVSGAGDASIQGFATDISVDTGDTVEFKIDTPSTTYRLDIYRLGYYGGQGARLVDSVPVLLATPVVQPECLTDAATGLIDCGNWGVSASWAVPTNAVSGIYLARAVREDVPGELASHIPFIVRDDDGGSDLLLQTARHHLAGLQPVRRQQPVHRVAGGARLQGQLQPAVHDPRPRARGLALQRGVPDAAMARAKRLRRQLYDRGRHRPVRQ